AEESLRPGPGARHGADQSCRLAKQEGPRPGTPAATYAGVMPESAVLIAGTSTARPHLGHLTLLPASPALAFSFSPQPEHVSAIDGKAAAGLASLSGAGASAGFFPVRRPRRTEYHTPNEDSTISRKTTPAATSQPLPPAVRGAGAPAGRAVRSQRRMSWSV